MKFKSKFDFLGKIINEHYAKLCIVLSFVLNFIIECAARLSFLGGILYFSKHPFYFIYNSFLILLTYLIALLFKKRIFTVSLVSIWWIVACIINSVLIHFRHTPFVAADFFIVKSAIDVMDVYLSPFQLISICVATVVAITSLIIILIKEKLKRPDYRKLSALLAATIIISLFPVEFISNEKDRAPKSNLTDEAYEYGFVCCFLNSIFNNGINEPNIYSQQAIKSIVKKFDEDNKIPTTPNIVVIQLESFIDPYVIKTAQYNDDPIPNFRKLKENYSSGRLGVSVFGGGTANTEFEVLTGMSTNFFGIGEYPYESILHNQTVESACYNLKELGYTSHAIHNHTGTFYDRYLVYKNLGFDTFTPIEHMNNVTLNALGWGKSDVFTEYIIDAMESTPNDDFVFAVTVQGHGRYPETINPDFKYQVTDGSQAVMNIKGALDFYINEIHEEDVWLGELINKLSDYPEPIMAIIYGDHMPSLNSPEDLLDEDDIYSTEYILWTNYQSPKNDRNLETYNLFPAAMERLNINNGIMTKLHQYGMNSGKIYSDELHRIQYDMLYGKKYVYGEGKSAIYQPTDMRLGIRDIVIENVENNSETTTIKGKNFTPYSVVCVNGHEVDTTFVDENTLTISSKSYKDFKEITIIQKATNLTILSKSKPYYSNDNLTQ